MIVPMKRVSLLVMDKDREAALERIRELGVVHLERKTASSPALTRLVERRAEIDTASGVLSASAPKKKGKKEAPLPQFEGDLASHVVALSERRKKLLDYMFNHQREISRFEKWGEFDPKDFLYLQEHGVDARLYDISFNSFENNTSEVPLIVLSMDKKNNSVHVLAFGEIPGEHPFPLPERPLSVVNERNRIRKAEMAKIEEELAVLSPLKKTLDEQKKVLMQEIEFETASAGMEQIENDVPASDVVISWISGYAPASDVGLLKRAASENGWAFCAADPAEDDTEVPTKLKNGKLTQLLYPLTDFLEVTPGYHEVDISPFFLMFFVIFFGMIFGDAAYGALLLLAGFVALIKTAKKGIPQTVKLLLLLGLSNFVWGALTCSWFGIGDTSTLPQILRDISLPLISNVQAAKSEYDAQIVQQNIMIFCFSLALLQLSIGHILAIFANKTLKALGDLGSIAMLVGMYFIILFLIASNEARQLPLLPFAVPVFAAGFLMNFIFANYSGRVGSSILESCKNIISVILGIANVFSDIMSYIRLWAVGLAGAAIASTINQMAGPMLGHLVFFIFGITLLVFGHGLNLVLNTLSVLVHGIRLNTLEFSGHAGLTWAGFAYKPFAKRIKKTAQSA